MKRILLFITLLTLLSSCTENSRARRFGGTANITVPCNQKVINITWKQSDLWFSTTPMENGYVPQTHNFQEESRFGLLEGNYILEETRCN